MFGVLESVLCTEVSNFYGVLHSEGPLILYVKEVNCICMYICM